MCATLLWSIHSGYVYILRWNVITENFDLSGLFTFIYNSMKRSRVLQFVMLYREVNVHKTDDVLLKVVGKTNHGPGSDFTPKTMIQCMISVQCCCSGTKKIYIFFCLP